MNRNNVCGGVASAKKAFAVYGEDGQLLTTLYGDFTTVEDAMFMVGLLAIQQPERGWYRKHLTVGPASAADFEGLDW